MAKFVSFDGLRDHLKEDPIPLLPFLRVQAKRLNDKSRIGRLKMISKGLVPNYPEWCEALGTVAPYVLDKPDSSGRSLFRDDEGPKATLAAPEGEGGGDDLVA